MTENTIIEIKELKLERENSPLLENVNLCIERGQIIFLLGPNGCGKSSLLSLFRKVKSAKAKDKNKNKKSGHDPLYEGEFNVICDNESVNFIKANNKENDNNIFYYSNIAYLDQNDYIENMANIKRTMKQSAHNALIALCNANKIDKATVRSRCEDLEAEADKCIAMLNSRKVKNFEKKRTKHLSGGQKRFVSFCRTYFMAKYVGSKILVLDEPLNHLDCEYKMAIDGMLRDLIAEREKAGDPITLIIVSHCLPFSFIKSNPKCLQFEFEKNGLVPVPENEKYQYNCLNRKNSKTENSN